MGQEEAKEKEEKKSVVSQTLIDILEAWKDHQIKPKDCDVKYSYFGAPYSHFAALNENTFELMEQLVSANPSLLKRKDQCGANIMFYATVSDSVCAIQFLKLR